MLENRTTDNDRGPATAVSTARDLHVRRDKAIDGRETWMRGAGERSRIIYYNNTDVT